MSDTSSSSGIVHRHMGLSGSALTLAQMALIVLPSFVLFGYNQSGLGGLLSLQDWVATFPEIDTIHTTGTTKSRHATLQGAIVGLFPIGALFGSLSCSYTGEKFGRRPVILAGAILSLIGEILQTASFGLAQFAVGRIILGAGIGMLSATVPVWQSECSSAKNRGKHVVLDGMFISLGYVLETWIDLGFYTYKTGSITWRPPLAIPIFLSLVVIGSVFLFPESPRWLMRYNRAKEARMALSALKGLPDQSTQVETELVAIEHSLEETTDKASLKDLLSMNDDKLAYRFGLCILLQAFQQLSGTNLISVYSTTIFQDSLGMTGTTARIMSGGTMTWKFLSCFVAFFTIDRFGRRAVFIVSGAGMSFCMVALAVSTSFKDNHAASISAAFFVYLFCFFAPIGFLGANYLYCTEIAPTRLRVAMASISTANHWLWNFVVAMITPVAISSIGYKYFIVYAVIGITIPITVYFLYPETMGRSLEELDVIFRDSPSALATVRYAKYRPRLAPEQIPESKAAASELEKV